MQRYSNQPIDTQRCEEVSQIDTGKTESSKRFKGKPSSIVRIKQEIKLHTRRLAVLGLNICLNHSLFFWLLGQVNKRFSFLHTIFVAYPASVSYTRAYVYPSLKSLLDWRPWIAGCFKQNDKWGLMMIITSTDDDFWSKSSQTDVRLKELVANVEVKRKLLLAPQKSFAGILPGVLNSRGLVKETPETDVTVEVVLKAVDRLLTLEHYPSDTPIIILGGKGFVGRKLMQRLAHQEIYCIDLDNAHDGWPYHLQGQKVLLVNVTKKRAIRDYLDRLWPELLILNETYPEPDPEELQLISRVGCPIYHIVGVKAQSYPSFPRVYQGGIPCCAAWNSPELEALVRKLN